MRRCAHSLMKRASLLIGSLLLAAGASVLANHHGDQPKQAMFKTQKEAEDAASGFGCEGAHRMGSMWMVCSQHDQAGHQGQH